MGKCMNKPVAWMFRGYLYEKDPSDWTVHEHPNVPVIPLYTHPAKTPTLVLDGNRVYPTTKTLTDEEIEKVFFEIHGIEPAPSNVFEFARAILRKAQEK